MVSQTNIATGQTVTFAYDPMNRMIGTVTTNANSQITLSVGYSYDLQGDLLSRTAKYYSNGSVTSTNTSDFVFDPVSGNLVLAFNGSGTLTDRYLYGPAVDELLADERVSSLSSAGTNLWTAIDNEGSVRDVWEDGVGLIDHIVYNSFGAITSQTNSSFAPLIGYTGSFTDPDTGLEWHNQSSSGKYGRWYDPKTQQWIGPDPSGLGPDANPYRYVGNDPTNGTDPSGLSDYSNEEESEWGETDLNSVHVGNASPKAYANARAVLDDADPDDNSPYVLRAQLIVEAADYQYTKWKSGIGNDFDVLVGAALDLGADDLDEAYWDALRMAQSGNWDVGRETAGPPPAVQLPAAAAAKSGGILNTIGWALGWNIDQDIKQNAEARRIGIESGNTAVLKGSYSLGTQGPAIITAQVGLYSAVAMSVTGFADEIAEGIGAAIGGGAKADAAAVEGAAGDAAEGAATDASQSETLTRYASGKESVRRLTNQSLESLSNPAEQVHGVSVTAGPPTREGSQVARDMVEKYFPVHDTPLDEDPLHRTVELPNPITKEIADVWNKLWGFK